MCSLQAYRLAQFLVLQEISFLHFIILVQEMTGLVVAAFKHLMLSSSPGRTINPSHFPSSHHPLSPIQASSSLHLAAPPITHTTYSLSPEGNLFKREMELSPTVFKYLQWIFMKFL